ncbi:MAG TPA: capsular biosynthesis protein [Cyanobacteria bacterium UBA11372]|nr:capsular biosynthesis protein [Cyanobacteria bacterium UBA11372]
MENEQEHQSLATQAPHRFQWLPQANPPHSDNNDDEGGLNLGQVVAALRRRVLLIAGLTIVVAGASTMNARNSKPTYQASFEILTKPVTVETQVISSVSQTLSNQEGRQAQKGVDPTKLKLLKSPKILAPIAKKLESEYPGIGYDEIAAGLVVNPLPESEILAVSYQDGNPKKVKAILEQVADAYLKYSLEERLADVQQGIEFVNAQLPQLQKRVETIQDKLQSFRQQYNLIDPESEGRQLTEQKTRIRQQRLETQVKLNEMQAIYRNLTQELEQQNQGKLASSVLSQNARYQQLLGQLLDMELKTAKDSSLYRENSPNIQVLQDQQQNLLPLLRREAQRAQAELGGKIKELSDLNQVLADTENTLNQRIKQLSVVSRQYTDIQRELTIATSNLDQFLTKREALRIDAGQRKTPWQILTPPTNPNPSAADVKRSGIMGAVLGLLMGVGVSLLLDKLSNVIHSAEEIKTLSKLPILGTIPHNPELTEPKQELISLEKITSMADMSGVMQQIQQRFGWNHRNGKGNYHYSSSPFREAFRNLYTNILLLSPDAPIRSLVVTSSEPGEGKSTICINLAQAAAAMGQQVLLVDADLRLPRLHERLELDNTFGLSTAISQDLALELIVQTSFHESNLSILTSGQVPPDPTKLLSSKKMQSLMERFKETYDLIIYDMPPLIGLADVKLLAPRVDGIVMVAGLNKTKASVLTQTLEALRVSAVTVFGIIANGSKQQNTQTDSYHHYYYTGVNNSTKKMLKTNSKQGSD